MSGPIKPSEVADRKRGTMPEEVFEAFNELIVERIVSGRAVVGQREVVARIVDKLGCPREQVFAHGWLDIEDVYRREGWGVEYDKPGFNETYEATFTFTKGPSR